MDWHLRYAGQAKWTRDLRAYIFGKIKLDETSRTLEVGCGTGAILSEFQSQTSLYGLDLDPGALAECKIHAPAASLVRGNALALPYADASFEIVYCHFLLLWVSDPLQALREMKRVTRAGGNIIAFAEPDYLHRIDEPPELEQLGLWQTESLIRPGADPGLGARLAELFFQARININETGTIRGVDRDPSPGDWKMEWEVIESDLAGSVSAADIQKMKILDQQAWEKKVRVLNVPTYFAWGSP